MPLPSLLFVHGPATGAWLWEGWRRHLGAFGWQAIVIDLRGHGLSIRADLTTVTMQDYAADLASVVSQVTAVQGAHPILGGWRTGALVAMMYAAEHAETPALLLLSPSLPLEAGGRAPLEAVREAGGETLGPETFGVYPGDRERSRAALPDLTDDELDRLLGRIQEERESGIAYRQVLRGISVPEGAVQCPSLILHTDEEKDQAEALKAHLRGDALAVPGVGQWGIVCHDPAVSAASKSVDAWLRSTLVPKAGL